LTVKKATEIMGLFRTAVPRDEEKREINVTVHIPTNNADEVSTRMILSEEAFMAMLYLERRRAERGKKRYVLLLVDVEGAISNKQKNRTVATISKTLCTVTRETDIVGWYVYDHILGVIATEIGTASAAEVRTRISQKVGSAFVESLGATVASKISLSFHFFPEEAVEGGDSNGSGHKAHYPELSRKKTSRKLALGLKRAMDIAGSLLALIVLLPLFAIIAVAIKITSEGPVLFRQERLGQHGRKFRFLKFRSMRTNCDSKIHQEYVARFIAGKAAAANAGGDAPTFKIQKDPRVTQIGSILRKTSLDELPQFWNVLVGEMSLVGPRPPLEYEFKAYDIWHRRRVLEIKPGITGLWQVEGRSRTQFDDMVRMDLKYARAWSLWLDVEILLRTPVAVISGDGAH
jgi:lipopolysaccharide/colanic/teichoic acid biosynthesis glycosyltransferase